MQVSAALIGLCACLLHSSAKLDLCVFISGTSTRRIPEATSAQLTDRQGHDAVAACIVKQLRQQQWAKVASATEGWPAYNANFRIARRGI